MTITMDSREVKWKLVDQYNRVVAVEPGRKLIVGRGNCDVPLKSASVDLRHALVEFHTDRNCPVVEDLNSENGTFVNDKRIGKNEATFLAHGDRLRFAYDNAVYKVLMCGVENGAENGNDTGFPRHCRPLYTDLEQLRLEEARRNSSASLSNGTSPRVASPCRRRSVQGSDEEVFPEHVAMDITDDSLSSYIPAPCDLSDSPDDSPEDSHEQKDSPEASPDQKDSPDDLSEQKDSPEASPDQKDSPEQEFLPVRDKPSPPPAPCPPRAPLSFTVPLEPEQPVEDPVEEKKDNLSAYVPPQIVRTMQEREAKQQAAREKREQERKDQEARERAAREKEAREKKEARERAAREKREQERKDQEARERAARDREAKEKKEARVRSSSLVRVGRGAAPPISDTRRRNVTAGAGPGDSTPSARASSGTTRPLRTSSMTGQTRRSSSRQRAPSSERSAPSMTKTAAKRTPSTDKRSTSSGSRGEPNSPLGLADGKPYLMNKMLDRKPAILDAAPAGKQEGGSASGPSNPPSEAGTYTIDSDQEKDELQLSDSETKKHLSQTAKSLEVLQLNYKNATAELQERSNGRHHRRDSDAKGDTSARKREDAGKNLLYNVFSAGNPRHTPSDPGSDAEISPSVTSRQRSVPVNERRPTAVRRSNSDTRKAAPAPSATRLRPAASASTSSSSLTALAQPRRRSSEITPPTPRKASNPMTTSFHKAQGGSSLMTSSLTGTAAFNRTQVGRFSLKTQKPESEALRRRKEYDPRKQVEEARVGRRKEPEGLRSASRRTNSADARPVTEGGKPAVRPIAARGQAPAKTSTVRRHDSLNAGQSGKMATSQRRSNLQPSTESLLAPSSAFLNVSDPNCPRSRSVHNGETSNTEVAYDLLLVSSIQSMSFRLRRGFQDLMKKLKEREIISRSPTPPGELYVAMPPAHMNSTNMELKDILENLKAMECLYQSLEARLIRDREEDHSLSSRSQTLGACTELQYREQVSRICSELQGFQPIHNDSAGDSDAEMESAATIQRPQASRAEAQPQASRFESSF